MTTTRNDLATDLLSKIARTARFQPTAGIIDTDDCQQEMTLRLINRLDQDPERLNDTPSRLICDATRNGAWKAARSEWIYAKYVRGEAGLPVACADDDDDDFYPGIEDFAADPGVSPEEAVIRREHYEIYTQVIDSLTPANKILVQMLSQGESESHIAAALGISRPAVTQRKKTVEKYLKAALTAAYL